MNEKLNIEYARKLYEELRNDYMKLMHKAMDDDNVEKVYQFNGSLVALSIFARNLGIIEDPDIDEDGYEVES